MGVELPIHPGHFKQGQIIGYPYGGGVKYFVRKGEGFDGPFKDRECQDRYGVKAKKKVKR